MHPTDPTGGPPSPRRTRSCRRVVVLMVAAVLAPAVGAAGSTVWRCGPEGSRYSDRPCDDIGQALDVRDARSAADISAAQAEARRWEAAGQRMATDRRALEHAHPPTGPSALNAPRHDTTDSNGRSRRPDPSDKSVARRAKKVHGFDPAQGFIAVGAADGSGPAKRLGPSRRTQSPSDP